MKFSTKIGLPILCLLTIGWCVSCFSQTKEKIWIDTDIAIGKWGRDVDDGIALIMAMKSSKVEIEGITLVSNVKYGYRITKKLLRWYGHGENIPVYKGASDVLQPGKKNKATKALTEALRSEKLTIIALGPATNIATVLQLHPKLVRQVKRIVWCAGRQPNLSFRPGNGMVNVCDCNFEKDPGSAQVLLSSGVELVLAGYEPSSYIYLSKKDLEPLKNSSFKGDQWLYKKLMPWYRIWRFILGSKKGFMPFDAVTVGCFIFSPSYMHSFQDIPVTMDTLKNDSRMLFKKSKKPYLLASRKFSTSSKADYYYWAGDSLKAAMLKLLFRDKENGHNEVVHSDDP